MARSGCSLALLFLAAALAAAEPERDYPKPAANSPDEPLAKAFSSRKAASFLDGVAVNWTRERKCGTCHTNYPYLVARPALADQSSPAHAEVRKFFEDRVANWDRGQKGDKPRWDAEVVATAALLALTDARTTSKLHALTRRALDRAWTVQQVNGSWSWLKCGWPPFEHDDYFGAVLGALGVGMAPDGYARSENAKPGLEKLRAYLKANPAPNLHHKAWLLWASCHLDGLLNEADRASTIKQLLALQKPDGGWCMPALAPDWQRRDKTANDPKAPSDGYATGLVLVVLHAARVPVTDAPIRRGVQWLRSHQRESGRWFTRSVNNDRFHFIANAGSCFAVMALHDCGGLETARSGQ
jgi:squalene-hopene/tetraprenyl-beta-curcumene cyclase